MDEHVISHTEVRDLAAEAAVSFQQVERVEAVSARGRVVTRTHVEAVIARTADQHVVTQAAVQTHTTEIHAVTGD